MPMFLKNSFSCVCGHLTGHFCKMLGHFPAVFVTRLQVFNVKNDRLLTQVQFFESKPNQALTKVMWKHKTAAKSLREHVGLYVFMFCRNNANIVLTWVENECNGRTNFSSSNCCYRLSEVKKRWVKATVTGQYSCDPPVKDNAEKR